MILALYFLPFFAGNGRIGPSLFVSDTAAVFAGVASAVSFVSYLFTPSKKYLFWASLTAYGLLCATAAALIIGTGGVSSPFVALWMAVAVFAGVFGVYGLAPLFLATLVYLITEFIGGALTRQSIITIVLVAEVPLAISYLLWGAKGLDKSDEDTAYDALANKLNHVSGEADVVITAIADGVLSLNSQGAIRLINPSAQQIIGWGKQDALALDYKSVVKLVDKQNNELTNATDPIAQVLNTNQQVTTNELSLITNSGKKLLVSVVVSPVGKPGSGVIVVFRDITKEKLEERQQTEFISTASHEMRTPVASIEGYLGLALNPATAQIDDKARDFILKAHESAEHLGHLFQDLLDVTKAEDNRLQSNPKVVDLVTFAGDIVQGLRPKADEKGLQLTYKPLPEGDAKEGERRLNPAFYVNVDNDHLREVIANLVENAIKYTPKGGVTIDVTGDSDHTTFSVTDSGIGIPAEDARHLFQKFYRVDNTETRDIGGTGLGLYLCRRLAESMNGRIWVESEYKKGSTFSVELPRTPSDQAIRLMEKAEKEKEAQRETPAPQIAVPPLPAQPTLASPQPVVTPLIPVQPQPQQQIQPTQVPSRQPTQQYQTPATPMQTTQQYSPPQTPATLSSIEQNPSAYIQNRNSNISVPPRNQ